jgi:hypothetical protein
MAIRKETVRAQFDEAVREHLEPGEEVVAGAYGASGPSPLWLSGLFGIVGMLIAGVRYYFVFVTDRRVLFLKGSFWTARPAGLAWSDLRSAVSIGDVTPASTWSWFRYQRPAGGKPVRLNFARPWREEFAQMTAALPSAGQEGGPVPTPPPPAT